MSRLAIAILGCLSTMAVSSAWGLDITACGQQVLRGQTGQLTTDLVCGPGVGLSMERGSTLDLAGHTLTMTISPAQTSLGVLCWGGRGVCSLVSTTPAAGQILRESGAGDTSLGVQFPEGGSPSESRGRGELKNVAVHGFDIGVSGHRVDLSNADISGNVVGVHAFRLRVFSSTIAQNSAYGLTAVRVRAKGSTITGNGQDIKSLRRPRLKTTSCDTSVRVDSSGNVIGNWGICALD